MLVAQRKEFPPPCSTQICPEVLGLPESDALTADQGPGIWSIIQVKSGKEC